MLTFYGPAAMPRSTTAQAQGATDNTHALTPKTGLDLVKAQTKAVLRAAFDTLPTDVSDPSLQVGDPYINGGTIAFKLP